jgi:HlyD family secretion protein
MDRPRTDQTRRRRKRWIVASGIALALVGVTVAVTRLKPAAPTVQRSLVWIDTVKRGEMLREVRGIGTLVPEQISWIAARSAGRIDHRIASGRDR